MTKWVSYGYGPEQDPEGRRAQEIEDELLREYFAVIVENLDRILETPRYFFCQLRSAWFSCLWFYGGGRIPLGVLALLWNEGKMVYDCPSCGFRLHAVGLTGSALTGVHSAWGFCAGCSQRQTLRFPSCRNDLFAVGELVGLHRNEPVIEKGTHPVFDWKDGLKGEFILDKVIVPAVEAVDARALIVKLRGSELKGGREEGELLPEPGPTKRAPQPIRRGFAHPIPLEKKGR
jgi:hypothetical protein